MSTSDLIVLVADGDIEQTIHVLLERHESLRIRPPSFAIFKHPERDPGCAVRAVEFLRPFTRQYAHALVVFDHEGSGREVSTREELEARIESDLARNGWDSRAASVAIRPELEAWAFRPSPHSARAMGLDRWEDLEEWLRANGFVRGGEPKPSRPKEAMAAVLRHRGLPRSAALFAAMARSVSLEGCADPSFNKLRGVLQGWFPP